MSNPYKPIILIGFMASGKTTIGKRLAELLDRDFIDIDNLIEEKIGLSISEVFQRYGEAYFREIEESIISKVLERQRTIIATGGGCVTRESTRRLLKDKGIVFWLKIDPETVLIRTDGDITRPLLKEDRERKVYSLLLQREPLYRESAHYTIDATKSPEVIVSEILRIIEGN